MSPTLLARLRRIERTTRRLATLHPAMPLSDFRRPVEMVTWRWYPVRGLTNTLAITPQP